MADSIDSMLSNLSDNYDKRPGSFAYDTLAPVAIELDLIKQAQVVAANKLLMSNLTGDELAMRIEEVTGLTRKSGVKATGQLLLVGTGTVTQGDIIETSSGLQALCLETKVVTGSGLVNAEAVEAGVAGNVPANQFTVMPTTIPGFTSVTNPSAFLGGVNGESDSELLARYTRRIKTPPSSGNPSYYVDLATSIPGIADARVFRAWDGPGTVKVVVISPDKRSPSASVVTQAADLIQANAPINAGVTVVGATEVLISIAATMTLRSGGALDNAILQVREAVSAYFSGIAFSDTIVRANRVGEAILSAGEALDYSGLTLNSATGNLELQQDQIPVIGAVNLTI